MKDVDITLEKARDFYGHLVPWELDEEDLTIINQTRRESMRQALLG